MSILLKFLSPIGKFLGSNKLTLFACIAILALGYAYTRHIKSQAILNERLEQKVQEIKSLREAQAREISNLLALSKKVQEEAKVIVVKEKKVAEILKEIPNVPESKTWAETPLPQSVIDSIDSIRNSVRDSGEMPAGTDATK